MRDGVKEGLGRSGSGYGIWGRGIGEVEEGELMHGLGLLYRGLQLG